MKYIVVALAGAADHPAEEFAGKTPFEVSKIPNLHFFAKSGKVGMVKLVSERLPATSDVTLFNLLGYDAPKAYTGRGALEAANLELKLDDKEVAFCMNFITEAGGILADPTAGGITTREAKALVNFLNKKVANDFVRFFAGSGHRHIAVIKDAHGFEALSAKASIPEMLVGKKIETHLPKGAGEELLRKLMYDTKLLLQDHEINQVRIDLQENPANMIWLWGQGQRPSIKPLRELFDISGGAMVAVREFAKGMGRLAGLTVMEVKEEGAAPSDLYEKLAKVTLDALAEKDFVCLHLHSADEAGQRGDSKAKISALEGIDFFIFSKIRKYIEQSKDTRLLITPCHGTLWQMKRGARDSVPFVAVGKNIMPDEIEKFSEIAAKTSDLKIQKGTDLLPFFLSKVS